MVKIKLNRFLIYFYILFISCNLEEKQVLEMDKSPLLEEAIEINFREKIVFMKLENNILFGFDNLNLHCINILSGKEKKYQNILIDEYYQCDYNYLDTSIFVANKLKSKFSLNDKYFDLKLKLPFNYLTVLIDSVLIFESCLYGIGLYDFTEQKFISRFGEQVHSYYYSNLYYDNSIFYVTYIDDNDILFIEAFDKGLTSKFNLKLKEKSPIKDGDVYFYKEGNILYLSFFDELYAINVLNGKLLSHAVFQRNIVGIGKLEDKTCVIVQNKQEIKVIEIKDKAYQKLKEFKIQYPDFSKIKVYNINNKMFFMDDNYLFELDASLEIKKYDLQSINYGRKYEFFHDKVLNESKLIHWKNARF